METQYSSVRQSWIYYLTDQINMDTDKDQRTGDIRKKMYAYLETKGLKVDNDVHNTVRLLMRQHSLIDNNKRTYKVHELINALSKATLSKDMKRVEERIRDRQCAICGIPMIEKAPHEFVAGEGCPHMKGLMLTVG